MELRTRRFRRVEYERMIECGILGADEHVELLGGALLVREPQGNPHAVAVDLVAQALARAFGDGWFVRMHAPLALGRSSRPEPDVAVIAGVPRDYVRDAPRTAALVVEVSDSSLGLDRSRKAAIYAKAGLVEYWIVNIASETLEVRRDPARLEDRSSGSRAWGYRSLDVLGRSAQIRPLASPRARIAVAELLP